ncbi:MAG: hypothetical protein QG670_529 [Thermoproteota archaeon]|nr:hypothetical protein [Thermoproteota archaeon]
MDDKIKEARDRILNWLKEEAFSPQEVNDPNAYFNFGIKVVGGFSLTVVQNVHNLDSIIVATSLFLSPNQISLLKNNMYAKKRQDFYWNLRLSLLRNNELRLSNKAKSTQ